jgi:hypothetical protein
MREKIVLGVVSFIALVSVILTVLLFNVTPVRLYRQTFTVQVNDELPTHPGYYVKANDSILEKCELHIEEVDTSIIAIYPAYVVYNNQRFDFQVMIEDTQKPIIELKGSSAIVSCFSGQVFIAADLVNVLDDSATTVYFEDNAGTIQEERITLKKQGNYEYFIVAKDSSGNVSSRKRIRFEVETDTQKPTITGVDSITLKVGDEIDLLDGVKASDDADGDLTSMLIVSPKELSTAKPGQFTVTYTVTDLSGNTAVETRVVTITDGGTSGQTDVGNGPFLTQSQVTRRDAIVQSLLLNELDDFNDRRFVENLSRYLMNNFVRSSSSSDNTSYDAIVVQKGNRMALVRAVKVILDARGIDNVLVEGNKDGMAWNMVKVDNKYRHLDVYANYIQRDESYCFLVTTKDLPSGYEYDQAAYPKCD